MKIQLSSKSVELVKFNFSQTVIVSKKKLWHFVGLKEFGKYYGNINGNSIWLSKEAFIPIAIPNIIFYGDIQKENDQIVVSGKFRYEASTYILFFIFWAIGVLLSTLEKKILLACVIPTIIILIAMIIMNLSNYKRMKDIVKFLREL